MKEHVGTDILCREGSMSVSVPLCVAKGAGLLRNSFQNNGDRYFDNKRQVQETLLYAIS